MRPGPKPITRPDPNPSGLCMCGCGRPTSVRSHVWYIYTKGSHSRFIHGHQGRKKEPLYVVDPVTGCWLWQRHIIKSTGYGTGYINGRTGLAHILIYELHKGPVPEGLELDHLCRHPNCVNPEHLEAVTHAVNAQRGSKAKLSPDQIREIRRLYKSGVRVKEISTRFPTTTEGYLWHIVRNRRWPGV